MAQVTGGKVTYSRKVQAAQYEPKDATVELSFSIDEGERDYESFLDQVANAAVVKVHNMLGLTPMRNVDPAPLDMGAVQDVMAQTGAVMMDPSDRTKADLAAEKIADVTDPASLETKPERKKPGRPPKVNKDPAALGPSEDTAEPEAQQTEGISDPAAITVESPSEGGGGSGTISTDDPASLGAEDWEASAPPMTDAEVVSVITKTNERVRKPEAIKQIIYEFAGSPPKTYRDIPVEVRPQFVARLEALA